MLYNYLFVQELGADEDYLINFVMQISLCVYLTAPFVKTDLILIFPGRSKRMLFPASVSEGLRLETHFSDKTVAQRKRKEKKRENQLKRPTNASFARLQDEWKAGSDFPAIAGCL